MLYRIAFILLWARRRRHRGHLSLEETRENLGHEPESHMEAPEIRMSRNEDVASVHRALALLSEDHKAILVLREMEDMAYEEIAEVLDSRSVRFDPASIVLAGAQNTIREVS